MAGPERIIIPTRTAEFDAVRDLAWAYRDYLLDLSEADAEIVRAFYPVDKYRTVLDQIETDHAPPKGQTRLAYLGDMAVGCGMVQTLPDGSAEIKRLYVTDAARGSGLGRRLCETLIEDCRAMGFPRILLDTSRSLDAAQRLYKSLGFKSREPYQPIPDIAKPFVLFYEMHLTAR